MNKKAGFAQPIIDFYAVIIIVTIIIIFFIVLKLHSTNIEVTIKSDVATIDGNLQLSNYIKAQIPYDGKTITIGEFIDLIEPGSFDQTLKKQLIDRTAAYFKDYESQAGCMPLIKIEYDRADLFLHGSNKPCKISASQRIPTISGREIIVNLAGGP